MGRATKLLITGVRGRKEGFVGVVQARGNRMAAGIRVGGPVGGVPGHAQRERVFIRVEHGNARRIPRADNLNGGQGRALRERRVPTGVQGRYEAGKWMCRREFERRSMDGAGLRVADGRGKHATHQ
jgi:hypothetical protein